MRLCVCTFNVRNYVQYENLCWHVQCEKLCLCVFFRWICFVQKRELPMSQCCFVRGERFFSFMQTLYARVIVLIKRLDVTILEEQGAPASGLADFRPLSSARWGGVGGWNGSYLNTKDMRETATTSMSSKLKPLRQKAFLCRMNP